MGMMVRVICSVLVLLLALGGRGRRRRCWKRLFRGRVCRGRWWVVVEEWGWRALRRRERKSWWWGLSVVRTRRAAPWNPSHVGDRLSSPAYGTASRGSRDLALTSRLLVASHSDICGQSYDNAVQTQG